MNQKEYQRFLPILLLTASLILPTVSRAEAEPSTPLFPFVMLELPEPMIDLWHGFDKWLGFPSSIIGDVLGAFATHPHLFILPVVVFFMVYGRLGERYGIHDLFWHSNRRFCFSGGVGVGAYLLMCLFLAYSRSVMTGSRTLNFHKSIDGAMPDVVVGSFYCFGFFSFIWIVLSIIFMAENGIFTQHRLSKEAKQAGIAQNTSVRAHAHWIYHFFGMNLVLVFFLTASYWISRLYSSGFDLHQPILFGLEICQLIIFAAPFLLLAIYLKHRKYPGHSRLVIGLGICFGFIVIALHNLDEPTIIRFWITVVVGLLINAMAWMLYKNRKSFASDDPSELRIGLIIVATFSAVTLYFSLPFCIYVFTDPYLIESTRNEATEQIIEAYGQTGHIILEWAAFVFLLLLGIFSGLINRNRYRLAFLGPEYYQKKPPSPRTAPLPAAELRTPEEVLKAPEDGSPITIVCVSGGGIKASAWTIAVLNELEEKVPGFSKSVRLFFGASGGMVGASYWATTLPDRQAMSPEEAAKFRKFMYDQSSDDQLSPVVATLYTDLLHLISPVKVAHRLTDRGNRMETIWEKSLVRADGSRPMNLTLDETLQAEKEGLMPSLVFSPMIIEDGKRLIISNADMSEVITNRIEMLNGDVDTGTSGLDLRSAYPDDGGKIAMKTAARLSASFPLVAPVGILPPAPGVGEELRRRLRVIDSGYYDNYGVNLAMEYLNRHEDILRKQGWPPVLVLQIDVNKAPDQAYPKRPTNPLTLGWSHFSEAILSPLSAGRKARGSIPYYRNRERLHKEFAPRIEKQEEHSPVPITPEEEYIETLVFRGAEDATMSWYLNPIERGKIREDARTAVEANAACLNEFFGNGKGDEDRGGDPPPAPATGPTAPTSLT